MVRPCQCWSNAADSASKSGYRVDVGSKLFSDHLTWPASIRCITWDLALRTMSDAAMRCNARCDAMRRCLSRQVPCFTSQTECLMCKVIQTAVSTCAGLVTLFLAAPSFAANSPHSSTTTSATESTGPPIASAFPATGCTHPPMPPTFPATGYTHFPAPPHYRDHHGC
jgi:hypothetical protein